MCSLRIIQMSGVISGFTVIFIVVGAGYLLGRTNTLGEHAHEVLSRLVFFVHRRCCCIRWSRRICRWCPLHPGDRRRLCVGHRCGLSAHRGAVAAPADSRTDHRRIVVVVCEQRQPRAAHRDLRARRRVVHRPLLLFQILIYSPIALTALDLTALDRQSGDGWRNTLRDAVVTPMTNPIVLGGVSGLVISLIGWQPPEAIMVVRDARLGVGAGGAAGVRIVADRCRRVQEG